MPNVTVADLVELFDLQPHPEGGYFKETYRSDDILPANCLTKFGGNRSCSTSIYFLIPEGEKSRIHRIKSDEMWHFYLGDPMTVVQISPDGEVKETVLGHDVKAGHKVQHVVPAGYWFGAYTNQGSRFSFVGCTVAPGFDFADFEMGDRATLLAQYPDAKVVITKLTD